VLIRKLSILLAVIGMTAAGTLIATDGHPLILSPKADSEVAMMMRAKLSSSQKVVEGLMAGDFEMIRKGGVQLQEICESDHWRKGQDQVFGHYRGELRRSALKLIAQADEQNLDGAAYTYMHTVATCVNCHQYSRDVLRIAQKNQNSAVVSIPVTEQEQAALQLRSVLR
jgi:hypothetical protein